MASDPVIPVLPDDLCSGFTLAGCDGWDTEPGSVGESLTFAEVVRHAERTSDYVQLELRINNPKE